MGVQLSTASAMAALSWALEGRTHASYLPPQHPTLVWHDYLPAPAVHDRRAHHDIIPPI